MIWALVLVFLTSVFSALGSLCFKIGSGKLQKSLKKLLRNRALYAGVLFHVLGTITLVPALKLGELSVLYPFIALSYIWVALLSKVVLQEDVQRSTWIGIVLILLGITSIGIGL